MPEGELRNRVKAAEHFAEAKDIDEVAAELAIAMELLFGAMFPDIPRDDLWSNLFLFNRVSYREMLQRTGELGAKAVRAIDDSLDEIQSQIQEIRHVVSLVTWGSICEITLGSEG